METALTGSELARRVEMIEEGYEFMLAYAAQGREQEDKEREPGIRTFLEQIERAVIDLQELIPTALAGADDFNGVVVADIANVRAILRFVLARPVITSQLIDNLNANMHLRALLTDLFLISEAAS
jgi:uncharacterized membrane protein YozB (DUF420 family)